MVFSLICLVRQLIQCRIASGSAWHHMQYQRGTKEVLNHVVLCVIWTDIPVLLAPVVGAMLGIVDLGVGKAARGERGDGSRGGGSLPACASFNNASISAVHTFFLITTPSALPTLLLLLSPHPHLLLQVTAGLCCRIAAEGPAADPSYPLPLRQPPQQGPSLC